MTAGWEGSLGDNGSMYMHGCVSYCLPENITTLFISYTPIQSFFLNVIFKNAVSQGFLDGPVGKTILPSIAGQGTRIHMPQRQPGVA